MAEIIRSVAFLQQCWSVHPLCLTVKRVEPERIVVLTCSSCRMVHRVTTGDHQAGSAVPPRLNRSLRSWMESWRSRAVWEPMLPPWRFGRWMCFKMRCGSAVRSAGRSLT
jgi:hypothetical protein